MQIFKAKVWFLVPAITGGFVIGYLVKGTIENPPMTSSDLATWFGAIGTIGAIVGSFFFGERQSKRALLNALDVKAIEWREKRDAFVAIAKVSLSAIEEMSDEYTYTRNSRLAFLLTYRTRALNGYIDALSAIPVHELGSPEAVVNLLGLLDCVITIQEHTDEFFSRTIPLSETLYPSQNSSTPQVLRLRGQKNAARNFYQAFRIGMKLEPDAEIA